MTSREKVIKTIHHEDPGEIVLDLGATPQTGISASVLSQLRAALGLEEKRIKVYEPFQILGEVDEDVRKALGVDVVGIFNPYNAFGVKNEDWKPWIMPDGTGVWMAGGFEYDEIDGETIVYPQGNRNAKPSMKLPRGGYFFDAIDRFEPIDESRLNGREDFKSDYCVYTDEIARFIEQQATYYYSETDYGIVGNFAGMGLGDAGALPGQFLFEAKGIRKLDDWLMAHMIWPEYVRDIFEMQTEVALKNLEIYNQAVGEKIQVITVSPTDFGTQNSQIISPKLFKELYKPYYTKVNKWIHENTKWKTFFHSCGSIVSILDDMDECGVDILNPVQCSATGMDPGMLKEKYGDKFVFWGGGVDTQHTLPFGNPEEVRREVRERINIFSKGGGLVFSTIHNIVGKTPGNNVMAMFETIKEFQSKE